MLFLHKYEYLLNYYRGRTGISFVFVGMSLCHRVKFVDLTSFFPGAAGLFGRSSHWLHWLYNHN